MSAVDDLERLLRAKADEVQVPPEIPGSLLRRARRRRWTNAALAGFLATALAVGGFAGVRAATGAGSDKPARPTPGPSSAAWPGIWPQATREEALRAQAGADAGDPRFVPQLISGKVASSYAQTVLGWAGLFVGDTARTAEAGPGPVARAIYSCDPSGRTPCRDPNPSRAVVTLDRLLRHDATGVWFVTSVRGPVPVVIQPAPSGSFVGVKHGDLVLVDVSAGETTVLVHPGPYGVPPRDVFVGPPGAKFPDVYYSAVEPNCTATLMRVSLIGGQPQTIAPGVDPAVSPDGRFLAYMTADYGCDSNQELVVRDLAGGSETRWRLGTRGSPSPWYSGVCRLSWLGDSRRLAYSFCYQDAGERQNVYELDTVRDRGIALVDGTRLAQPDGTTWILAGNDEQSGGLVVWEFCCGQREERPPRIIAVDPANGQLLRTLVDPAPDVVFIRMDLLGRILLYETMDGQVFRFDGAQPVKIADGYQEVFPVT